MYVCIYIYINTFFSRLQVDVTSYWLIFYFQPVTGTRNHPKKSEGSSPDEVVDWLTSGQRPCATLLVRVLGVLGFRPHDKG